GVERAVADRGEGGEAREDDHATHGEADHHLDEGEATGGGRAAANLARGERERRRSRAPHRPPPRPPSGPLPRPAPGRPPPPVPPPGGPPGPPGKTVSVEGRWTSVSGGKTSPRPDTSPRTAKRSCSPSDGSTRARHWKSSNGGG